jgi:hypothetical protein
MTYFPQSGGVGGSVNGDYLPLTGGTLTGPLTIDTNGVGISNKSGLIAPGGITL